MIHRSRYLNRWSNISTAVPNPISDSKFRSPYQRIYVRSTHCSKFLYHISFIFFYVQYYTFSILFINQVYYLDRSSRSNLKFCSATLRTASSIENLSLTVKKNTSHRIYGQLYWNRDSFHALWHNTMRRVLSVKHEKEVKSDSRSTGTK